MSDEQQSAVQGATPATPQDPQPEAIQEGAAAGAQEAAPSPSEEVSDDAILHGDAPVPQEQEAAPAPPVPLDPLRPVTIEDLVPNRLQVTIGGRTYWMHALAEFGRGRQARFFAHWNRVTELERVAAQGYHEYPNPDPAAAETQPVIRQPVDLDEIDDEIVANQRAILKIAIRGVSQQELEQMLPDQVDGLVARFLALLSVPVRRKGEELQVVRQVI